MPVPEENNVEESKNLVIAHLQREQKEMAVRLQDALERRRAADEEAEKYGDIHITYETAREVLSLIEHARAGSADREHNLQAQNPNEGE